MVQWTAAQAALGGPRAASKGVLQERMLVGPTSSEVAPRRQVIARSTGEPARHSDTGLLLKAPLLISHLEMFYFQKGEWLSFPHRIT